MNLTQYYDSVAEEERVGSFIADILLKSSKGYPPILVEIKVSHACEKGKIQSDHRIIEIELNKEEDLELIESCQLKQTELSDSDCFSTENQTAIGESCFPSRIPHRRWRGNCREGL